MDLKQTSINSKPFYLPTTTVKGSSLLPPAIDPSVLYTPGTVGNAATVPYDSSYDLGGDFTIVVTLGKFKPEKNARKCILSHVTDSEALWEIGLTNKSHLYYAYRLIDDTIIYFTSRTPLLDGCSGVAIKQEGNTVSLYQRIDSGFQLLISYQNNWSPKQTPAGSYLVIGGSVMYQSKMAEMNCFSVSIRSTSDVFGPRELYVDFFNQNVGVVSFMEKIPGTLGVTIHQDGTKPAEIKKAASIKAESEYTFDAAYLFTPGISGQKATLYATANKIPPANGEFRLQIDGIFDFTKQQTDASYIYSDDNFDIYLRKSDNRFIFSVKLATAVDIVFPRNMPDKINSIIVGRNSSDEIEIGYKVDGIEFFENVGTPVASFPTNDSDASISDGAVSAIHRIRQWNTTSVESPLSDLNIDFWNQLHHTKEFVTASGDRVTIDGSGSNPATLILDSCIRFSGSEFLETQMQTLDSGENTIAWICDIYDPNDVNPVFSHGDTSGSASFYSDVDELKYSSPDSSTSTVLQIENPQQVLGIIRFNGAGSLPEIWLWTHRRDDVAISNPSQGVGPGENAYDNFVTGADAFDMLKRSNIDLFWVGMWNEALDDKNIGKLNAHLLAIINRKTIYTAYLHQVTSIGLFEEDMKPARVGEKVAFWDGSGVITRLSQSNDLNRPTLIEDSNFNKALRFKSSTIVDTKMETSLPDHIVGTMIVGTNKGTCSYDVFIPKGVIEFDALGKSSGASHDLDCYGIIIYNFVLSDAERAKVEEELSNRVGSKRSFADTVDFTRFWEGRDDI